MLRHSDSVNKRDLGSVLASSLGRMTCLCAGILKRKREKKDKVSERSVGDQRRGITFLGTRITFATYRYSLFSSAYFSLYSMREALLMVDGKKETERTSYGCNKTKGHDHVASENKMFVLLLAFLGQRRSVALSHGAPRARRPTLCLIVIQVMHKGWG